VTITASGANTYSWNTGPKQSTLSVSPATTTAYVVTGTNTSNGCVTKATVQVSVTACTGVDETKGEARLTVYPNPSSGELHIQADKTLKGAKMILKNLKGELILTRQIVNETELISGLLPGVYFLSVVRAGTTVLSKKVVVEQSSD